MSEHTITIPVPQLRLSLPVVLSGLALAVACVALWRSFWRPADEVIGVSAPEHDPDVARIAEERRLLEAENTRRRIDVEEAREARLARQAGLDADAEDSSLAVRLTPAS